MPFKDDWKKAKTAFETATGKKKPSATFLGVFRKGTGLESALKDMDGAKTAGDLRKAMASFEKAYGEYIAMLKKAAADPKSVPAADKPDYIKAIGVMEKALDAIHSDAAKVAETLGGADKKEKVDTGAIKEANDHLAMRIRVAKQAQDFAKKLQGEATDLKSKIDKCKEQAVKAANAAKKSDTMNHMVAVGVIDRYIEEASALAEARAKEVLAMTTSNDSEFMKARMDPTKVIDKLPQSQREEYRKKSNAAWSPVGNLAAEMNSRIAEMKLYVEQMKGARSVAEGMGNQMRDPKEYVAQLVKLAAESDKLLKEITIKGDRVVNGRDGLSEKIGQCTTNAEREKVCKLQEDQWGRYGPEVKAAKDRFASYKTQGLNAVKAAGENPEVKKALQALANASNAGVKYCETVIAAGEDLLVKTAAIRSKLK